MKLLNMNVIRSAQDFSSRWGFLTKDIFFQFVCPMSTAQQYRYWRHLVAGGYFVESKATSQVLLLSKRSRSHIGNLARPSRLPQYIEHDSEVAKFFLSLWHRGLISDSWLEDELMRQPIEAYRVLGADRVHRIPDLVFDLRVRDGQPIRCALEIERTVKTQSRYARIALAYLGYSRISIMFFGCSNNAGELAVQKAFNLKPFLDQNRVPGVYQLATFDPSELKSSVRFQEREFGFKNLIEILSKSEVSSLSLLRERNENSFSSNYDDKTAAA